MNRLSHVKIGEISRWLRRGLSIREIAKIAEVNRNTVLAYKKLIASGATFAPLERDDLNDTKAVRLILKVRPSTVERLDDKADQFGLTRQALSERIVELITDDDLFDAILDN